MQVRLWERLQDAQSGADQHRDRSSQPQPQRSLFDAHAKSGFVGMDMEILEVEEKERWSRTARSVGSAYVCVPQSLGPCCPIVTP